MIQKQRWNYSLVSRFPEAILLFAEETESVNQAKVVPMSIAQQMTMDNKLTHNACFKLLLFDMLNLLFFIVCVKIF